MINKFLSKYKYFLFKVKSYFNKNIIIGSNGRYHILSEIDCNNNSKIIIGNNCTLLRNVSIRVRENAKLEIGNNVFFNNNTTVTSRKNISIGSNTIIGPNVCIFDHDHDYKSNMRKSKFVSGNIEIGENVWIGCNAVILKNVKIGNNAVIAAGAIVNENVEEDTVYYNKDKKRKINYERN